VEDTANQQVVTKIVIKERKKKMSEKDLPKEVFEIKKPAEKPEKPTEKESPFPIELFTDLLMRFIRCTRGEALNIISGIVTKDKLEYELVRFCLHLKDLEEAQRQVESLITGHEMVMRNAENRWVKATKS